MSEQKMRAFYIKHRLENLPGGGRFMSAQQDDGSMIDVEDIPGGEWDAFIRGVKAEAWAEGFEAGERDAMDPSVETHTCTPNPYKETPDE